jgi:hypothetical protein
MDENQRDDLTLVAGWRRRHARASATMLARMKISATT